jgi:hypothetical protein
MTRAKQQYQVSAVSVVNRKRHDLHGCDFTGRLHHNA